MLVFAVSRLNGVQQLPPESKVVEARECASRAGIMYAHLYRCISHGVSKMVCVQWAVGVLLLPLTIRLNTHLE